MDANLEILLVKNNELANKYKKNLLMQLIESQYMSNQLMRSRLLDCIQVFSDYFQKIVMLRNVFCEDHKFIAVTQEHLSEEFQHNLSLANDRKNKPPIWDPILDATSSWFTWKMFTLDNEEKTVLVHLVLEASANIFFQAAHQIMQKYGETNYFKIHSEADEKHEQMGIELLKDLKPEKYLRLFDVQQKGWDVINATCARIAEVTLAPAAVEKNEDELLFV